MLSTKIYWDKPKEREAYKKFWDEYKKINAIEDSKDKNLKKEILFIKNDLKKISGEPNRYKLVISTYKKKLVELGVMKEVKDKSATKEGKLQKKKANPVAKEKTAKKTKKEKVAKETDTTKKSQTKTKSKESEKAETAPKKRGRPRKNV